MGCCGKGDTEDDAVEMKSTGDGEPASKYGIYIIILRASVLDRIKSVFVCLLCAWHGPASVCFWCWWMEESLACSIACYIYCYAEHETMGNIEIWQKGYPSCFSYSFLCHPIPIFLIFNRSKETVWSIF